MSRRTCGILGRTPILRSHEGMPHLSRPQRPKAAAMLCGLLAPTHDPANAPPVFEKYKSQEKAALIVNMVHFNHACVHKACRFCLPTLEGLAHSLHNICADPWVCELDLKNCYRSVHLPASLVNCIRVAASTDRYAIVRVPFGWHEAPGLVQHLIDRVLSSLPPTAVLIIQYLDDILFVGPRPDVRDMAYRAVAALVKASYIISPKSELEPTKLIAWMGKTVNLESACIAPSTPFVADVVSKWLLLAHKPYQSKSLRRPRGKIVWLGGPAASVGSWPRVWLNEGPFWSPRTPFAIVRSLLEAIAASSRGWEPCPISATPPVRIFSDAAPDPISLVDM